MENWLQNAWSTVTGWARDAGEIYNQWRNPPNTNTNTNATANNQAKTFGQTMSEFVTQYKKPLAIAGVILGGLVAVVLVQKIVKK